MAHNMAFHLPEAVAAVTMMVVGSSGGGGGDGGGGGGADDVVSIKAHAIPCRRVYLTLTLRPECLFAYCASRLRTKTFLLISKGNSSDLIVKTSGVS